MAVTDDATWMRYLLARRAEIRWLRRLAAVNGSRPERWARDASNIDAALKGMVRPGWLDVCGGLGKEVVAQLVRIAGFLKKSKKDCI